MSIDPTNPPTDLRLGDLESDDVRRQLRAFALESLYFFSKSIIGYQDMTPRVHYEFCEFMQNDSLWKLGLMPRGHFKSSVNMADIIRRLALNPEERILLVSESAENAELMLGEIKGNIMDNVILQAVFPEIVPKNVNRTTWTANSVVIPRKGTYREGSIDAAGVTSKIVSRHYTLIKCDDLISDEAMESPSLMKKAKKFVNRLISLLVNPLTDEIHAIGTRWAYDDVYGHMIDSGAYDVFIRKAIVLNPETGEPEPFFPQRYSMEQFQRILAQDPDQWATQYANDPRDTSVVDFKPAWLQYFKVGPDRAARWEDEYGSLHQIPLDWMRFYIHVDPSMGESPTSDYSGIVVVGLTPYKQIMVTDAIALRLDPIKLVEKIIQLSQVYVPKRVSVESNAYQKSILYWLDKEARRRGVYVPAEEFRAPSKKSKPARIRGALQPFFANREVWVREGLTTFVEEYLQFGKSDDDHLMDALAQGPEFWKFPVHPEVLRRKRRRAEIKTARGITGYCA